MGIPISQVNVHGPLYRESDCASDTLTAANSRMKLGCIIAVSAAAARSLRKSTTASLERSNGIAASGTGRRLC